MWCTALVLFKDKSVSQNKTNYDRLFSKTLKLNYWSTLYKYFTYFSEPYYLTNCAVNLPHLLLVCYVMFLQQAIYLNSITCHFWTVLS